MKKSSLIIISIFILNSFLYSQGTSGADAKFESRNLIDMPTAGILAKGNVATNIDVMPYGVVVTRLEVGVFDNFSFGISYGGSNIIGTGKVSFYKLPGINVKARIVNETIAFPAIAIGFDSQGKGLYDRTLDRYEIKSPGFILAASKNFELFGYLSIHGVINYSLERDDADKDLNLRVGFEKTIGSQVSVIGEYDFAINDNTGNSLGEGNGYLNLGIRWSLGAGLTLGLNLRDMLENKKLHSNKADRGIFVEYIEAIF